VYYPRGFNVYRQDSGQTEWTKLNDQPINVRDEVPQQLAVQDEELSLFLNVVKETPYEEFQASLARVFVVIKAIKSSVFAELLGIIFYDQNVTTGSTYKYRVMALEQGNEVLINESSVITAGPYEPINAPQDMLVERKKRKIEIIWKPEEYRYYGVNVYRQSSVDPQWVKINDQPRNIQRTTNQQGDPIYPDVFYEDTDIEEEIDYTYKLTAMDFFGQESKSTDDIDLASRDFDPPPPPINLDSEVEFLKVTLTWEAQPTDDLAGFNIYRSETSDGPRERINAEVLNPAITTFEHELTAAGGYYFSVAAVDLAGNERATRLFIEVRDIIPPSKPQQVLVKADTGKVFLSWAANAEEDLLGYYVYKSLDDGNNADNQFLVINTDPINENQYVEELPRNVKNKFVYALVAVDQSLNRSEMSELSVTQLPDVSPPVKPFIKNSEIVEGNIVIEWLANPDDDLSGYNIYRSNSTDSINFRKLNVNPYPTDIFKFTDRNSSVGTKYFYYITAMDDTGNESEPSNIYTVTNQNAQTTASLISNAKAEYLESRNEVVVSWDVERSSDFKGIVIYRRKGEDGFSPLTGLMQDSKYTDKQIRKGSTYYYEVRSYTESGVVAKSDLLQASITE